MKTVLVSAALLSVITASATAVTAGPVHFPGAPPDILETGEGGNGAGSVKLASAVTSAFLFVPGAAKSPLITIGEGGEGGKGRRGRGYYGSPRYRPVPYQNYYAPSPSYYYGPSPPYYQNYYAPPRYGRPYDRRDYEPGEADRGRWQAENPANARRSPRSDTGASASAPNRDVVSQPAPTSHQQSQEQQGGPAATRPRAPAEAVELPPAAHTAKPEPSSEAASGQQQHSSPLPKAEAAPQRPSRPTSMDGNTRKPSIEFANPTVGPLTPVR